MGRRSQQRWNPNYWVPSELRPRCRRVDNFRIDDCAELQQDWIVYRVYLRVVRRSPNCVWVQPSVSYSVIALRIIAPNAKRTNHVHFRSLRNLCLDGTFKLRISHNWLYNSDSTQRSHLLSGPRCLRWNDGLLGNKPKLRRASFHSDCKPVQLSAERWHLWKTSSIQYIRDFSSL